MAQPATQLEDRVTRLENQMAEVTYLATKNDRDVSNLKATLHGHTGVLDAIGETLREHGLKLAEHGVRLGCLENTVDRLERKVDDGFMLLGAGQAEIKALLTKALNDPAET